MDEYELRKREILDKLNEIYKKIQLCDDPDELLKLNDEHHEFIQKLREILLEKKESTSQ